MTSRRALSVVAALLAVPLLAGCQALERDTSDALYPNLESAQASEDGAKIPSLVPDDARSVRLAYHRTDEDQVMSFTSTGGLTDDGCEEGWAEGAPAFTPGWWPAGELATTGWSCGDWTVVSAGADRYLVWS